jgi:hypothetical protein
VCAWALRISMTRWYKACKSVPWGSVHASFEHTTAAWSLQRHSVVWPWGSVHASLNIQQQHELCTSRLCLGLEDLFALSQHRPPRSVASYHVKFFTPYGPTEGACVFVFVCVYIYVYVCVCVQRCVPHTTWSSFIRAYTDTYIHLHTYTDTYIHIRTDTDTYIYVLIQIHTYMYVLIQIHTYIYVLDVVVTTAIKGVLQLALNPIQGQDDERE